ncbi:MAG: ribosome biogenesis GTP-binding protein YihA/YsxC [Bacteroidota bacterium]
MQIHTARFHSSHSRIEKALAHNMPEFAFIGRSNVGKSSLINKLVGRKQLARTSHQPGKTQLLNLYLINEAWFLADLPGYGYAKVSKKTRGKWQDRLENYFTYRAQLTNAFVLIDGGIPPQKIDIEFCNWMGEKGVPFALVFTKIDKRKYGQGEHIADFQSELLQTWSELPPIFKTSAVNGQGREELLGYIQEILNM